MFDPFLDWASNKYKASVAYNLKKYGLRYEDLLDPMMNLDVAEAIKRMPQEEIDLRNQRLKRSSDISLKKSFLDPDLQAIQTPYNFYIRVEEENKERVLLGGGKTYERSIP